MVNKNRDIRKLANLNYYIPMFGEGLVVSNEVQNM